MSAGWPTDGCGVVLALVLVVAAGVAGCSKGVEPLPPREGAPLAQASVSAKLPSLAVADLGGRLSTIDSLRGRILVLNVWATWCAPCRREMPSLDQLHRELDPSRYLVVGIAVDDDPILGHDAFRGFDANFGFGHDTFNGLDRDFVHHDHTLGGLGHDLILVREYLAQQRLGFANFVAVRRSDVLDALALRGIPATFVVAADGTVLHRISGPRDWSSAEVREMLEAAYDIGARRSAHAPRTRAANSATRS